jgi:hypothetical protein
MCFPPIIILWNDLTSDQQNAVLVELRAQIPVECKKEFIVPNEYTILQKHRWFRRRMVVGNRVPIRKIMRERGIEEFVAIASKPEGLHVRAVRNSMEDS